VLAVKLKDSYLGVCLFRVSTDPIQDEVVSKINHHLVLILADVLDQVAFINVVVKVGIMNFLRYSCSSMPSEKGELDASGAMALRQP